MSCCVQLFVHVQCRFVLQSWVSLECRANRWTPRPKNRCRHIYLASTFFQLWHLWFVTGPCRLEVCTAHGSDSLGVLEEKESQHAREILHHRMAEVWALPFMELEQNCIRCMLHMLHSGRNELNRWKHIRIRYPESCLVLSWHWSNVTYSYDFERVYAWMGECMHACMQVRIFLSFCMRMMHVLACVKAIHFYTFLEILEPVYVIWT